MELRRYVEILEARKWVVVVTMIVTIIVAGLGSFWMTPVYSASTTVRIAAIQDNSVGFFYPNYLDRLMHTYVQLLRSRPFLEQAIQRLDLNILPEDLVKTIKAEALSDSELIKITAESSNPRLASDIANMLATLLIEQGQKVYFGQGKSAREILQEQLAIVEEKLAADRVLLQSLLAESGGQAESGRVKDLNTKIGIQEQTYATLLDQYEKARLGEAVRANSISVVEPATIPEVPSKPRVPFNIALGALVGLVGGIGLAFLIENLDSAIHSADDLETLAKVPLLGSIPSIPVPWKSRGDPILLNSDALSPPREAFRILRSNILAPANGSPPRTLLIASAEQRAGKSTVSANLAAAMAQAGRRVVVVDSDLRRPCLHQVFEVPNEVGLSNIIQDSGRVDTALQATKIQGVRVLTSGPFPPDPAGLLGSSKMKALIQELAQEADIVLFDAPPILAVAETAVLAPMVDGVLLVAARDQTTGKRIQRALKQLEKVGARALGIVFNKAKAGDGDYYYYYYPSREMAANARSVTRSLKERS